MSKERKTRSQKIQSAERVARQKKIIKKDLDQREQLRKLQEDLRKLKRKNRWRQACFYFINALMLSGTIKVTKLAYDDIDRRFPAISYEYEIEETTLKDGVLETKNTGKYKQNQEASLHYEGSWHAINEENYYRYVADTTDYEEIERFLKQYSEQNNISIELLKLDSSDIHIEEKSIDEIDLEKKPSLEITLERTGKERSKKEPINNDAVFIAVWAIYLSVITGFAIDTIFALPFKRKLYPKLDEVKGRIRKLEEEKES